MLPHYTLQCPRKLRTVQSHQNLTPCKSLALLLLAGAAAAAASTAGSSRGGRATECAPGACASAAAGSGSASMPWYSMS